MRVFNVEHLKDFLLETGEYKVKKVIESTEF